MCLGVYVLRCLGVYVFMCLGVCVFIMHCRRRSAEDYHKKKGNLNFAVSYLNRLF